MSILWRSQLGQDKWVYESLDSKRGGYFVDVGAADGVALSNTFTLEQDFGWSGICIEPHDEYFAALVAARRCRCVHALVLDTVRSVEFQEAGFLSGLPETFNDQTKRRLKIEGVADGRVVTKQARTLGEILDAEKAPSVIDFLSLDTEGAEPAILSTMPFDRYCFRRICVEHNGFLEPRDKLRRILNGRGYSLVTTVGGQDDYWTGPC